MPGMDLCVHVPCVQAFSCIVSYVAFTYFYAYFYYVCLDLLGCFYLFYASFYYVAYLACFVNVFLSAFHYFIAL